MSEQKRIGLLGGSFNPVHLGHLRAAEIVRERFCLAKVIFIPASVNPLKIDENNDNTYSRIKMLEIATGDNPFFDVSDIEIKRGGTSYTIDTLMEIQRESPENSYYFIMGSELFSDISSWKRYKELFNYANFIVVGRPGCYNQNNIANLPLELKDYFRYLKNDSERNNMYVYEHRSTHTVNFVTIQGFDLSSTMIRDMIKRGCSIKYLVPHKLEQYIISNSLYMEVV